MSSPSVSTRPMQQSLGRKIPQPSRTYATKIPSMTHTKGAQLGIWLMQYAWPGNLNTITSLQGVLCPRIMVTGLHELRGRPLRACARARVCVSVCACVCVSVCVCVCVLTINVGAIRKRHGVALRLNRRLNCALHTAAVGPITTIIIKYSVRTIITTVLPAHVTPVSEDTGHKYILARYLLFLQNKL